MSGVIPGQNTDDSALAVMVVTSWCAECRAESTLSLNEGGGGGHNPIFV